MPTRLRSPPPDYRSILARVAQSDPARLSPVLSAVDGPLVDGKYLHWGRVRYRKPPADLEVAEWWMALKMHRLPEHAVPLLDRRGAAFGFNQSNLLHALHQNDLTAGGPIGMPDQVLNAQTRDSHVARSLVEEAFTSSQLEGAASTRAIAKELIRKERQPRTLGERMILNNYRTMQRILELRAEDLTADLIRDSSDRDGGHARRSRRGRTFAS